MKVSRVDIRGFRAFAGASVHLGPATVLVGANDSGKSGFVDAITWLFHGEDRSGFVPTAQSHTFRSNREDELLDVIRDGGSFPPDSVVTAWLDDLSARQVEIWGPAVENGAIRIGRRIDREDDGSELHLVVSEETFARLSRSAGRALDEWHDLETGDEVPIFELHEDGYWISLNTLAELFDDGDESFWPQPHPDPFSDFPAKSNVVLVRGPEFGPEGPEVLLRPLIRSAVLRRLARLGVDNPMPGRNDGKADRFTAALLDLTDEVIAEVSEAYADALPRYVAHQGRAVVCRRPSFTVADRLVDLLIGELTVELASIELTEGQVSASSRFLEEYGAGTRRASTIAGVELFRDPKLASPEESVLLVIEEPEVGLHPAAQRQVAQSLAGLSTFGVQTLVVTHSPVFVNAVDPKSIRIVRNRRGPGLVNLGSVVVVPEGLEEISRELGSRPADVLLARVFLIVEGESDALVLTAWAQAMGFDLRMSGVQIVPAGGHTTAHVVGRFLAVAYEGSRIVVLLDQGRDTEKSRREIEARFGDRVNARLLGRTEMEGYFAPQAIERWLRVNGVEATPESAAAVASAVAGPNYKRGLRDLCTRSLARQYSEVRDGAAIARLMQEHEIAPEIRGLLTEFASSVEE